MIFNIFQQHQAQETQTLILGTSNIITGIDIRNWYGLPKKMPYGRSNSESKNIRSVCIK